ncbi:MULTISPECIES: hypothetical protein [Xanthobacter]|uniref:hypothetical protein n=1 Tax=Xanthobacter TaxID=279 RepID=UPI0024AD8B66|nr:hypothetical protein [Xanthobacter autotrophicus]
MPRPLARPVRFGVAAFILGAGLMPLAPATAQVLLYEGPYGYARPYGPPPRAYPVPPAPPRGYSMLPPGEVRDIVVGMGYRQVSRPRLAGRTYVVTGVDEDGPAVLRLDAFTGRVVSARSVYGGPTIAVPTPPGPGAGPRRAPSPSAPPRAPAPVSPPVAAAPAAPLPPSRPSEGAVAAVTPGPAVTQPAPSSAPAVPGPEAAKGAAPQSAPTQSAPAQSTPAPTAPASAAATASKPDAGRSAAPQSASASQRRKAGAGTATTDNAAAGSASVLSRPKAQ